MTAQRKKWIADRFPVLSVSTNEKNQGGEKNA